MPLPLKIIWFLRIFTTILYCIASFFHVPFNLRAGSLGGANIFIKDRNLLPTANSLEGKLYKLYLLLRSFSVPLVLVLSLGYIFSAKSIGILTAIILGVAFGFGDYWLLRYSLQKLVFSKDEKQFIEEFIDHVPFIERLKGSTFHPFVETMSKQGIVLNTLCFCMDINLIDRKLNNILSSNTLGVIQSAIIPIIIVVIIGIIDHLHHGWKGALLFGGFGNFLYTLLLVILGPSWLITVTLCHMVNNSLCLFPLWHKKFRFTLKPSLEKS